MTSYTALRALIGEKKFDQMVRHAKQARKQEAEVPVSLASMTAEPENSGLTIPEGRKALRKATKRKFDLPSIETSN